MRWQCIEKRVEGAGVMSRLVCWNIVIAVMLLAGEGRALEIPLFVRQAEAWLEEDPIPREPFNEASFALVDLSGDAGLVRRWESKAAEVPRYWLLLAYHASHRGDSRAAFEYLAKAPRDVHGIFARAYAHYQGGQDDEAAARLREALVQGEVRPRSRRALGQSLANYHWGNGDYAKALGVWEEIWKDHEDIETRMEILEPYIETLAALGRLEAFAQSLVRASDSGGGRWPHALYLAELYRRGEWLNLAAIWLDRVPEDQRDHPLTHRVRWKLLADQGKVLEQANLTVAQGYMDDASIALLFRQVNQRFREDFPKLEALRNPYLARVAADVAARPLHWAVWMDRAVEGASLEARFARAEWQWSRAPEARAELEDVYWAVAEEAIAGKALQTVSRWWDAKRSFPVFDWRSASQRRSGWYERSTSRLRPMDTIFRRLRHTVRDWPEEHMGNTSALGDEGHLRWIAWRRLDQLLGRERFLAKLEDVEAAWRLERSLILDDADAMRVPLSESDVTEWPVHGPLARALFAELVEAFPESAEEDRTRWQPYLERVAEASWGRFEGTRFSLAFLMADRYAKAGLREEAARWQERLRSWAFSEGVSEMLSWAWYLRKRDLLDGEAVEAIESRLNVLGDIPLALAIWQHDCQGRQWSRPASLSAHAFPDRWHSTLDQWLSRAFPRPSRETDGWKPFDLSVSSDLKAVLALQGQSEVRKTLLEAKRPALVVQCEAMTVFEDWSDGRLSDAESLEKLGRLDREWPHFSGEWRAFRALLLARNGQAGAMRDLFLGWEAKPGSTGYEAAQILIGSMISSGLLEQARRLMGFMEGRGMTWWQRHRLERWQRALDRAEAIRNEAAQKTQVELKAPKESQVPAEETADLEALRQALASKPMDVKHVRALVKALASEHGRAILTEMRTAMRELYDYEINLTVASVALKEPLPLEKEDAPFFMNMSRALVRADRPEEALALLERLTKVVGRQDAGGFRPWRERLRLLAMTGRENDAAAAFADMLEDWPEAVWASPPGISLARCHGISELIKAKGDGFLEELLETLKERGEESTSFQISTARVATAWLLNSPEMNQELRRHIDRFPQADIGWLAKALRNQSVEASLANRLASHWRARLEKAESVAEGLLLWQSLLAFDVERVDDVSVQQYSEHLLERWMPENGLEEGWVLLAHRFLQRGWAALAKPIVDKMVAMDKPFPNGAWPMDYWLMAPPRKETHALMKEIAKVSVDQWPPQEPPRGDPHWNLARLRLLTTGLVRHRLEADLLRLETSVRAKAAVSPVPQGIRDWLEACAAYRQRRDDGAPSSSVVAGGKAALLAEGYQQLDPIRWVGSGFTAIGKPKPSEEDSWVFPEAHDALHLIWESQIIPLPEPSAPARLLVRGVFDSPMINVTLTVTLVNKDNERLQGASVSERRDWASAFTKKHVIEAVMESTAMSPEAVGVRVGITTDTEHVGVCQQVRVHHLRLYHRAIATSDDLQQVNVIERVRGQNYGLDLNQRGDHLLVWSSGDGGGFRVLDVKGEASWNWDSPEEKAYPRWARFVPGKDGADAVYMRAGMTSWLWPYRSNQPPEAIDAISGPVDFLTLSPEGRRVALSDDEHSLKVFDLWQRRFLYQLNLAENKRFRLHFHQDSPFFDLDGGRGDSILYETATGEKVDSVAQALFWKNHFEQLQAGAWQEGDPRWRFHKRANTLTWSDRKTAKSEAQLEWKQSQRIEKAVGNERTREAYFITTNGLLYRWPGE